MRTRQLTVSTVPTILDLALKGCANQIKVISDALSFVQDLAVFIRHSPLRMSMYENIAKGDK